MTKNKVAALMPIEHITKSILVLRRQRVLLDRDLAEIYGVETRRLNEAIKRNSTRFAEDFMFQLTEPEAQNLRSQICDLKLSTLRGSGTTTSEGNPQQHACTHCNHSVTFQVFS